MSVRNSGSGRLTSLMALGGLLLAGAALFVSVGPGSSGGDVLGGLPGSFIQIARADVGKGEYQFLPCRREMWVVNRTNGKFVHYQFFDTEMTTVDRSRIAAIDQNVFPLRDTLFLLSDRNLNSYLWVVNTATGDFQMWRANRDGTLTTDELWVQAGEALKGEPSEPRPKRTQRGGLGKPPPPDLPQGPASKKKLAPLRQSTKDS